MFFLCLSLPKHWETQRKTMVFISPSLSVSLSFSTPLLSICLSPPFLSLFFSPVSLPFISFINSLFPSLTFLLLVPLSGHLSSSLSILFYHSPPFLSLSLSLSLWFCRGRVEVISRCVTPAMCRQWTGLWQWLNSLGPQWQRRAGEGNNYTCTWEDLRLFTKRKKLDTCYFIYCFIFSPSDWWPSRWMGTRRLWFG